jgi:hypothetical protein
VVVEAGPATADRHRAGEDVTAGLVGDLCRLLGVPVGTGDVRVVRTLAAPGAVAAPTAAWVTADAAARAALAGACPQALLTGALLAAGATSMNDQIVQGSAVADQLR